MKELLLAACFVLILVAGYFVMDRLDRFLEQGGISPYWDKAEEAASTTGCPPVAKRHCRNAAEGIKYKGGTKSCANRLDRNRRREHDAG